MKKAFIVLATVVITSFMMASCSSHRSCPAYGKVHQVPVEKQV